MLNLNPASRRMLTAETLVDGKATATYCDLDGKPLTGGRAPYPVLDEVGTGKSFARVAEMKPSLKDPQSLTARAEIEKRNPVFVDDSSGLIRGWYVPVDDYSLEGNSEAHAA